MKEILQSINDDVKDIINTEFEFVISDTVSVPNDEDPSLTFETNQTKKGKNITTCVLYIDIRNSTKLNEEHLSKTMGKLYTAFIKSMIVAADYHNGSVRNIIGDRVMVVFPEKDCFTNAVECAVTMNTIATQFINYHFKLNEFKCGIGIAHGKMLVLKTGAAKQGKERAFYKNLVWVGKPANVASKLTDAANKEIEASIIEVKYFSRTFPTATKTQIHSLEEFSSKLSWKDNKLNYEYGNIYDFEKTTNKVQLSPILMTEVVFFGYKKSNSTANDIKNNSWKLQTISVKGCNENIYGSSICWDSVDKIKK